MQSMFTVEEASAQIRSGRAFSVAGDERLLKRLPEGKWIGGSIPYFMSEEGGSFTQDKLMMAPLPEIATAVSIRSYATQELTAIPKNYPGNGFSRIILPAFSECHRVFAEESPNWPGIFDRPLVGWVAGVALEEIGRVKPKLFNGESGEVLEDQALVLNVSLPEGYYAQANILNLFRQGGGASFRFPENAFTAGDCRVNGEKRNFAAYFLEQRLDIRLPLVADYGGVMVNVGIRSVDAGRGEVSFYAPVFPGLVYRQAAPIGDYVEEFAREMGGQSQEPTLACNCILNYLYASLEGRKTGEIVGPMTFGEIAYMLLNQTLVYTTIEKW